MREERRRASRDFTSLIQVTAVAGEQEVVVAGTTIGRDARAAARARARLRDRDRARAAHALRRERRPPGLIGRLGTILGEAGVNIANMAVSRNRRSAKALMALTLDSARSPSCSSASSRARLRRGALHRPGARRDRHLARAGRARRRLPREAAVESRVEEFLEGTPTAEDAANAVGLRPRQIVKSLVFLCDGKPVLVMVPETGAPIAPRSPRRRARRRRSPAPTRCARDRVRAGRRRAVPAARRSRRSSSTTSCSSHEVVWTGAGSHQHVLAIAPPTSSA